MFDAKTRIATSFLRSLTAKLKFRKIAPKYSSNLTVRHELVRKWKKQRLRSIGQPVVEAAR